jgi:hypothetical protein
MTKFNLSEYIKDNVPKRISKNFMLTGKKIRSKNLKQNQLLLGCIVQKAKDNKKSPPKVRCFGLQILGFVDSYELEEHVYKKVGTRFRYFEDPPVDDPLYISVRDYLREYDFSNLSDEGFENAVYESPILYAKRIGLGTGKASQKPYALLLAHEDEKFEWRSNGTIVWFELKEKES